MYRECCSQYTTGRSITFPFPSHPCSTPKRRSVQASSVSSSHPSVISIVVGWDAGEKHIRPADKEKAAQPEATGEHMNARSEPLWSGIRCLQKRLACLLVICDCARRCVNLCCDLSGNSEAWGGEGSKVERGLQHITTTFSMHSYLKQVSVIPSLRQPHASCRSYITPE